MSASAGAIVNCVNTVCKLKKLHKKPLHLQNHQHLNNCVLRVCRLKLIQTDNNCKQSVSVSVKSVMQSVCARLALQLRYDTLCSSAIPCATFCTLSTITQHKCLLNYTHRDAKTAQSNKIRCLSVEVPCLQIRVGQFDSGPRLHYIVKSRPCIVQRNVASVLCTLNARKLQNASPLKHFVHLPTLFNVQKLQHRVPL